MGIRINKVMGYGLDNLQGLSMESDQWDNTGIDERLARHPQDVFSEDNKGDYVMTRKSFFEFVKNSNFGDVTDRLLLTRLTPNSWNPQDSFKWECEGGDSAVLVIVEPTCPDWYRRDDNLDYVDYVNRYGDDDDMTPKVSRLSRGIYPYSGYSDIRTGRKVKLDTNLSLQDLADSSIPEDYREELTGIKTGQEILDFARPTVPFGIQMLCRWLGLFKEDTSVYVLRPLIYTYWS
jgi:hypothetical protein